MFLIDTRFHVTPEIIIELYIMYYWQYFFSSETRFNGSALDWAGWALGGTGDAKTALAMHYKKRVMLCRRLAVHLTGRGALDRAMVLNLNPV